MKPSHLHPALVLVTVVLGAPAALAELVTLRSPDRHLTLTLEVVDDGAVAREVPRVDTLRVKLAPGGGVCVLARLIR